MFVFFLLVIQVDFLLLISYPYPLFCRVFSLDDFTDYNKHFTVMNYREESSLKQIHHDEFIPLFEEQYPDHKWPEIQV